MRNDDYEAVEDLERGIRAAEREIAELERENKALKSSNANLITELQSLQCPTFMGEPVITKSDIDAAVSAEREACAKVCEANASMPISSSNQTLYNMGVMTCANAIRGRGKHK